jgi:hypothetical protein
MASTAFERISNGYESGLIAVAVSGPRFQQHTLL